MIGWWHAERCVAKEGKVTEAMSTDLGKQIQTGATIPAKGLMEAVHIGESDVPFVDLGDGSLMQLQMIDLNQGLWVVRTQFKPGYRVDKHYHTGQVFAVTYSGCWFYDEYPDYKNRAGSFLYEPAHSVHTLHVADDIDEVTDIWFAVYGANVNMDKNNQVTGIVDAQGVLAGFRAACAAADLDSSQVLVIGG